MLCPPGGSRVYLEASEFMFRCALVNSNTLGRVSGKFVAVIKRTMIRSEVMRARVFVLSLFSVFCDNK